VLHSGGLPAYLQTLYKAGEACLGQTLAYYEDLKVMDVKSFMTLSPDFAYSIYKIFQGPVS
jgi:hypothetical protein